MNKLYYDRENKKFYVKVLVTNSQGFMEVATDEEYVDVTDEILELLLEHSKDDKQLLCIETNSPLPDTVYHDGKKFIYIGNPCPTVTAEKCEEDSSLLLGDKDIWKPTPAHLEALECEQAPSNYELMEKINEIIRYINGIVPIKKD